MSKIIILFWSLETLIALFVIRIVKKEVCYFVLIIITRENKQFTGTQKNLPLLTGGLVLMLV